MSAITGHRQSPQLPPKATQMVTNDGWWPDVDMGLLRETVRLPGGVTDARLVFEVKKAIRFVNNELAEWKAARKSEGCSSLAEVPSVIDDDPEVLTQHYLDAVYSKADSKLCEKYRNTDTTGAGDKRADMIDARVAEALRDKHLAVTAILAYDIPARMTITVDLI